MKKAFIKAISYYLPESILTNEDVSKEFPEWSVEKVASKIGVSERHVVKSDETALDIAVASVNLFFEETNIAKSDIDFVLLCTQSPDYFLPTSACILQDRVGLPTSCGALDFNLGCSGYIYGLALAKGLICSGVAKNILLVTSETYTKHLHPRDKGNRTIFGDAAATSLISTDGFAEIKEFSLGTDGSGANNLIVKSGGMRHKGQSNTVNFDESNNPISDDYLYMNGTEIFNFTLSAVPPLVGDILDKNNKLMENIDLFIFHQANKYMLDFIRKKIKIPQDKFYIHMENVGNTVSSTLPIAIKEAFNNNLMKGNVLITGFGVGYSYGGVILECKS